MQILLVASAFNSLTQRVFAELRDHGHRVAVELVREDDGFRRALAHHSPDLVVAPMLTTAIPKDVWSAVTCLVVHPGPVGDRGPSSLDWAVAEGAERWGVTVLQAEEVMDAGDVWAAAGCAVPPVGKSDLYRGEVADAATAAVLRAVERFASGTHSPQRQTADDQVRTRPWCTQDLRRIDWSSDPTGLVLRKLRAADSQPGVRDVLLGAEWFLHGGHPEDVLRGEPGRIVATRDGAVCRATVDGAVWIPQLRRPRTPGGPAGFKLPAVTALGGSLPDVPEVPAPLTPPPGRRTWTEVEYHEHGPVGLLRFSFPGGAMSTGQCHRLLAAYRHALTRPTSVLVLGGARDFFSNGIHLNVIEAAPDPAAESWENINAMDDLVEAVLTTGDRLTVAAVGGNASAGGVMLALAADEVWCRAGSVLNPHYRLMGLYGSEYWTDSLPRRVGPVRADRLMRQALPVSSAAAHRIGLVDRVVCASPEGFGAEAIRLAAELAASPDLPLRTAAKAAALGPERLAELAECRRAELERMRHDFWGPGGDYHRLRSAFVRKERTTGTPEHLAAVADTAPPRPERG
ncbi:hydrogenase maturation protein [Streptomyces sp. NPDC001380]|uniref:hydrogenase maturation protein n=1 Tax=Streptomyces sp. NPDC001380 TaxID=3364566 RepID=UPI00368D59D2